VPSTAILSNTEVCLKAGPDWQTEGESPAGWAYGIGTYLNAEATVYFPDGQDHFVMEKDTEVRLPDKAEGTLQLIGGKITVLWKKAAKIIGAISAGGDDIDPEFVIFSLSHDAEYRRTELRVYAGEATLTRRETDQEWRITPWQSLSLEAETVAPIRAIVDPAVPVMAALLGDQKLPGLSPWQLSLELDQDPNLDPIRALDRSSQLVLGQLMEGLFRVDPEGNIVPGGVTGFESSDDGHFYTLSLEDTAAWSDEKPVVAQHYVDAICRAAAPESEAEQAALLYFIAGVEGFHLGETTDCNAVGIRSIDDFTLEIELVKPLAEVGNLLVIPLTYPVRLDIIERCGERWPEPGCFESNGPYRLVSWAHGQSLTLEKNPDYWDADRVDPESLEFSIAAD
jgi:hypothetical protein